jgi:Lar family restriction alleviation protein
MNLKPCPFCGSTKLGYGSNLVAQVIIAKVVCSDCKTCGPGIAHSVSTDPYLAAKHKMLIKLEEAWNKRSV